MGILEALLKLKSTEMICVVLQFNVSEIVYMNVYILKHDYTKFNRQNYVS